MANQNSTDLGRPPSAVRHQLAGRVVDCRDVVGVEGMAKTEDVGCEAQTHAEDLRAHGEVPWGDDEDQHAEPHDVHEHDDRRVRRDLDPVLTPQRLRWGLASGRVAVTRTGEGVGSRVTSYVGAQPILLGTEHRTWAT